MKIIMSNMDPLLRPVSFLPSEHAPEYGIVTFIWHDVFDIELNAIIFGTIP